MIVALIVTVAAGLFTWALFKDLAASAVTARRDEILAVLIAAGVVVIALPRRLVAAGAAAMATLWTLAHLGVAVLPDVLTVRTPVDQAVGGAALTGTDFRAGQIGIALATLLGLAGAAAIAFIRARRGEPAPAAALATPAEPGPRRNRRGVLLVLGALLVMAVALVPQLGTSTINAPPGWDAENLTAWQWAIDQGLTPMRDFFYPYSETWVFNVFPWGQIWEWLANCTLLGLLAWALWRLSPPEGRATRTVVGVALLFLMGVASVYYWRYAGALILVAAYAAIGPASRRRPGRDHAILAFAATFVGLYDIGVLIQAAVGCVLIVLVELIARRLSLRWGTLRALAVDALPFAVAAGVTIAIWVARGSVPGNLRWWLDSAAIAPAWAPDESTQGALAHYIYLRPTLDMLLIGASFLLLAGGLVHAFSNDRRSVLASRLMVGAAGVGVVFLYKHLLRPQGTLTLVAPLLGFGWAGLILWNARRLVVSAAVGVSVAAFAFTLFGAVGGTTMLQQKFEGVPDRVQASIDLATDKQLRDAASRRRFDPAAYDPATTPTVGLVPLLRQALQSSPNHSFAVLGDAQSLYYFLGQRPPFHVQLYNASPMGEQKAMVDALEKENPQFLFSRRDVAIDGVPGTLRAPLVYQYAVDRYVPTRAYADPAPPTLPYEILRLRRPGEPIAVEWWRNRLSETATLGFVPWSSDGDEDPRCGGGDGCAPYVIARRAGGGQGQTTIRLTAGGRVWHVAFTARGDEDTYAVRLDHLWFGRWIGANPVVSSETPGWRVAVERRRGGDSLY